MSDRDAVRLLEDALAALRDAREEREREAIETAAKVTELVAECNRLRERARDLELQNQALRGQINLLMRDANGQ